MKYTETTYNGTVEFLAADDFVAIPAHVTETTLVKAGTPLTAAGKGASTGTNAVGIVLYDTDPNIYKIRVALHQREHDGTHGVLGQEMQGAHHEPP